MTSPSNQTPYRRHPVRWLGVLAILLGSLPALASQSLTLRLGALNNVDYLAELLTRVLQDDGLVVDVITIPGIPTTRLERMLEQGAISAMLLGETPARNQRLLPIYVEMTDNLMNQRILFIPRGQQERYSRVHTLEDFRALGVVAGMGSDWRDLQIWQANNLPVTSISGDWRRLYEMLASGGRGIDYLPRGAMEMAGEWSLHRKLQMEEKLVLVYPHDHILYISPQHPELHARLARLLPQAHASGLIRQLAHKHFQAVFEAPVNLQQRRVIHLTE